MAKNATFEVKFRRRRKGKTDYKKRMALLKSGKPRLVVRKSNLNVLAQIIVFGQKGDIVKASAHSNELKKYGWRMHKGNIPSAYLTGLLAGRKAKQKKIEEAILDIGIVTPVHGSVPFAVLKGAIDAGLNIAHEASAFPSEERIRGEHIKKYLESLSKEKYAKMFSEYAKENIEPAKITEWFEQARKKINEATFEGEKEKPKEKTEKVKEKEEEKTKKHEVKEKKKIAEEAKENKIEKKGIEENKEKEKQVEKRMEKFKGRVK